MNFNTKAEYLAAVAIWKEQYVEVSQKIRDARQEFKNAQRVYSKCNVYMYNPKTDEQKANNNALVHAERVLESRRSEYAGYRSDANDLLAERAAGKVEAQRQYLAAHA